MVYTQLVQYRCMEIMHVYRVVYDIVAQFICFAVNYAGFYAAAGHPNAEAAGVVVAAVIGFFQFALAVIGTAEFAAPNYQRFVQQAALF